MRLAALTLTKIECDIVEVFVRHTAQFVDRIIMVDNASLDNTRALLEALAAEQLPLTIWIGEAVTAKANRRSELVRRAFEEFEIDYLLLLDPDELLVAPSRTTLETALEALPAGAHALVPWRTYVPTRMDDLDEINPIARIRYRLAAEIAPFFKVLVNRAFLETPEATITPGNHGIDDPAGTSASMKLSGIALAHFPARSVAQMQNKALLGWPRFLAMGFNEESGLALHWRHLNEELYAEPDWNLDKFLDVATRFQPWISDTDQKHAAPEIVLDPLPTLECRYPQKVQPPLATAIEFTRQIAQAYAASNSENVRLKALLQKHNSGSMRYLKLLKDQLSAGMQEPERTRIHSRLGTIQMFIENALAEPVIGDVMQAGLSRGETAIFMRAVLEANSDESRRVWVADSFIEPSPQEVRSCFRHYGLLDDRVIFVEGSFSDTLATCPVDKLSVLGVNVAAYDATYTALESLYERISPKGFVIIQKYGSSESCRSAVENFRSIYSIVEPVTRIDEAAVYWRRR
jgi:hypothetical protein